MNFRKFLLVPLLIILFTLLGKAQYYYTPNQLNPQLSVTDFRIVAVIDARAVKSKSLGEVYTNINTKETFEMPDGIEKGVFNYLRRYNPNKVNVRNLIFKITEMSIEERKTNNTNIEGNIKYLFSAYTVVGSDTSKLCNSRNSGKYNRGINSSFLKNVESQFTNTLDNGLNFVIQYIAKNNSKLEAFALDSRVIIKPFHVKNAIDTVFYQHRKVTWADFKGPIRSQSNFGAAIFTSFGIDTRMYTDNNVLTIEVTPKVFSDKNMSWAKPEIKNDYSLSHEQLHFDISYWMTLKFLQKIKTFKAPTKDDLISMIQYEYLEFYRLTHKMQEQYDAETNHSIKRDQQLVWQRKVSEAIKAINLNSIID